MLKQVSMNLNCFVFGSYTDRCRALSASGNCCADGWLDPSLQKAGFPLARIACVSHTRPVLSIIGLCRLGLLDQMILHPSTATAWLFSVVSNKRCLIANRHGHTGRRVAYRVEDVHLGRAEPRNAIY